MAKMLSFVRSSRSFFFYCNCLLRSRQSLCITTRPFTCYYRMRLCKTPLNLGISNNSFMMINLREKSDKRKKKIQKDLEDDESDDDDDEEEEEEEHSEFTFKGDEIQTYVSDTARVDKILKVCFKISRKDIENLFYQTKVRVNGQILKKKSVNACVGDVIDIIKGFVNENSKYINVNRIEILNIKVDPEKQKCIFKVKKAKSLTIENYSDNDEWRS